jgi:hypothetical protein
VGEVGIHAGRHSFASKDSSIFSSRVRSARVHHQARDCRGFSVGDVMPSHFTSGELWQALSMPANLNTQVGVVF